MKTGENLPYVYWQKISEDVLRETQFHFTKWNRQSNTTDEVCQHARNKKGKTNQQ